MKRVISGRIYDTRTATEVASDSFGFPSDFRSWIETLYRSPRGQFFTAGHGGPMTKFARTCEGNSRCGGAGIEVLSDEEALEWCERHRIDPDVVSAHFQVEEG